MTVLKTSKDGMPTWDSLIPIVLKYAYENDREIERREMKVEVSNSLDLSTEMRNKVYKSTSGENVIENRVAFAISSLKRGGLFEYVERGVIKITPLGKQYYIKYGNKLNRGIVESTQEFMNYEKEKNDTLTIHIEEESSLESFEIIESIDEKIDQARRQRKEELFNIIINSSPYLFEKIVVLLLSKMGYKGKGGESFVTKKSNDGGIDGFIHHDPLGTQTVYIQAKRYRDSRIQRQEVEKFYGALSSINANRGVLITTSFFSKGAIESAKRLSIILIDRDQLMDLLIDYEVGVEKDKVFYTYKIDDEFFEIN